LIIENLKEEIVNVKLSYSQYKNFEFKILSERNKECSRNRSFFSFDTSCQNHALIMDENIIKGSNVRASMHSINDEKFFDPELNSTCSWMSVVDEETIVPQASGSINQSPCDSYSNEVFSNCEDDAIQQYPHMSDQDQYSLHEDFTVDLTVKWDELKDVKIKKMLRLSVSSCFGLDLDDETLESNFSISCDETILY